MFKWTRDNSRPSPRWFGFLTKLPVIFTLRISQTLLDVIIFGLAGWLASHYYQAIYGFTVFVCLVTLLNILYQVITAQLLNRLHSKSAVLVLECLVSLWWFCIFVASTALYFGPIHCNGLYPEGTDVEDPGDTRKCSTINSYQRAVIWFSLIEWLVFIVTSVMVVRTFIEYRRDTAINRALEAGGVVSFASDESGERGLVRDEEDNPFSAADYDSRVDGGAGGYTYQSGSANGGSRYAEQYEMSEFASPYDDSSPYAERTKPYSAV
ncbi:hypothetical protein V1525DRAFT_4810 [Lipomyces kononenkoae]|uniref:Uncharacterized protein n=1 Tax=Lipomyces kononenkoae TaxID=34357 RepID=A0ACC3TCW5_LIPKO